MGKYIIAIDVGKGTEDIMIWSPHLSLENSIQLVMPSTAQLIKRRLEELRDTTERPIFITGDLMAGEPWHKIVYEMCEKKPGSVVMDELAARSLRYNLNQVRKRGVKVVSTLEEKEDIYLSDVNWERLFKVMETSNIYPSQVDAVLLCCQDHGEPENKERSTRDFRMVEIYAKLEKEGKLETLLMALEEVPRYLPRLRSIGQSAMRQFPELVGKIYVMDSSPAVVYGAMKGEGKEIIINAGNGHTVVMFLADGRVQTVFETHTAALTQEKLWSMLELILNGELTHEEVLAEGGHGLFTREVPTGNLEDYHIGIIGPNRSRFLRGQIAMLHPGGNMMMAGPIGLLRSFKDRREILN